jgi:hypothetical protein
MNAATRLVSMMCLLVGCSAPTEGRAPVEEGLVRTAAQPLIAEPGQYVRLTARHSGKCLGVSGSSQADEAQLLQWDCNGSRDQAFLFESLGSVYRIRAWHSGKCLALAGSYIVQRDCGAAAHFTVAEHGDGSYSIVEPYSQRYLDVESASIANGDRVLVYTPTGGNNQRFTTLAYREQAGLDACNTAPSVRDELAWCSGYYVSHQGCWTGLTSHIYDWCRRYGVNFGASWGPGYDNHRYYDAIDRCAFWHDYTTWSVPNDPIINDAQAWMCMAMVQPASLEEERARSHGVYWLPHDPATLSQAGSYIDPRLASRASGRRPAPFPVRAGSLPQPDSFMRVPWARQQGGYWNEQQWVAGDFNGDGATDLAKVFNDNWLASVDVHLTGLRGFTMALWERQAGGFWDTQKWIAGDFNGDGYDDLANVFSEGGLVSIDVHVSSGSSFTITRWVTQQGVFDDGQRWMAMRRTSVDGVDINRTDLVSAFFDNGYDSIAVRRSTGSTFAAAELWATRYGVHLGHAPVSPATWAARKWLTGNFNTVGSVARVYSDGGLASVDVYVR